MSNLQIAEQWASKVSRQLNTNGVWSTSLYGVPQVEQILRIYKRHFSKVVYNALTHTVVCYK
jgi:hypothetical protein